MQPLATVEEISAASGGAWPVEAKAVARICQAANQQVRSYCGWHIFPRVKQEIILDGEGTSTILLPSLLVHDVEEVAIRSRPSTSQAGEEYEPIGEYEWSKIGLLRRHGAGFPARYRSIRVVLDHGYEEVPADIAQVVIELALTALAAPAGITREQTGAISVSYGARAGSIQFSHSQLATLAKYVAIGRSC